MGEEYEERIGAILVRYSSDVITVLEADGTIRYESPAVERVLGYAPGERAGENAFSYVHPDDLGAARDGFGEILGGAGVGGPVELRSRHKDGSWRWVEGGANNLLSDPDVRGIVANFRDVTGRREVEGKVRFQAHLLDAVGQAVVAIDLEGRITYWNRAAEALYGWTAGEAVGRPADEILVPEDQRGLAAEIRAELAAGGSWSGEFVVRRRDGTTFPVSVTDTPVFDERGNLVGVIGVSADITERKRAEEALGQSEERYRAVVEQTAEGIYLLDAETRRVIEANAAFGELLGYPPEELRDVTAHDFVTQSPEELEENIRRTLEERRRFVGERRYRRKDGSLVDVEVNVSVISYGGRDVICAAVRDVTERKAAEERLRESEERFRALARNASDIVSVVRADGSVGYVSPSMRRVLGHRPEERIGKSTFELVHPGDVAGVRDAFGALARGALGATATAAFRMRHADGSWRCVEAVGTNLIDDPSVCGVVVNYRDVTERKALEGRLAHQATHDALTGLPNRALFSERVARALGRAGGRASGGPAVLFADLDNFKYVNDSLGHGAGDELLVAVAGRLRAALRPGDTVARLGGDEFAVLLENVSGAGEAERVAGRIVGALRGPFAVHGREAFVTSSIGVALARPGRGASPGDLLREADLALYEAKRGGKARHAVFGPGTEARVVERLGLENGLRRALERGEFVARYQPIVRFRDARQGRPGDTGGWRVVGFEVLLRWRHPERGLLFPSEFLPLAEELGLTVPIGRWLVGEACRRTKEWQERHPSAAPLAVGANLSARQLSDPGLLGDIEGAAREAGLDPEQVTLEVTEDAVVGEAGRPVEALRGLKDAGFLLALDDFGVGHSSLSHLRRLPIGLVKIDRSFVERLGEDGCEEDEVLLSGIVGIAHGLGLLVCAEGVETEEQLRRVGALGCGLAQGYYFSRPLEAEEASALLARGLAR